MTKQATAPDYETLHAQVTRAWERDEKSGLELGRALVRMKRSGSYRIFRNFDAYLNHVGIPISRARAAMTKWETLRKIRQTGEESSAPKKEIPPSLHEATGTNGQ